MGHRSRFSPSSLIVFTAAIAITLIGTDASAQHRGGGGGGGHAVVSGGHAVVRGPAGGVAVARPYGGHVVVGSPYYRGYYYRPYYPYYRYPYYGYPYFGFGVGFGIGFGVGGYYGYGYPYYYGYPAPYYYGYPGYAYQAGAAAPVAIYGAVKVEGAPANAQVYADGSYVGLVNDFQGGAPQFSLQPGPHNVEIRHAGGEAPTTFDVNVQAGRTLTVHAR
jgi:hypothetical protein